MSNPFNAVKIEDIEGLNVQDIKNLEEVNSWNMCCFDRHTDARMLKYMGQYIIILSVLFFCFSMLVYIKDPGDKTVYISMITLILGVVLPGPSSN